MSGRSTASQRSRNCHNGPEPGWHRDDAVRAGWEEKWNTLDAEHRQHHSLRSHIDGHPLAGVHALDHISQQAVFCRDGWADYPQPERAGHHHRGHQQDGRWFDKVLPRHQQSAAAGAQHAALERGAAHLEWSAAAVLASGGGGGGLGAASEADLEFLVEQQEGRRQRQYAQLLTVQRELEALDSAVRPLRCRLPRRRRERRGCPGGLALLTGSLLIVPFSSHVLTRSSALLGWRLGGGRWTSSPSGGSWPQRCTRRLPPASRATKSRIIWCERSP